MVEDQENSKAMENEAEGRAEEAEAPRESKLRWMIGWVLIPGSLLFALFLAGVHVGANFPDMWLSRLIGWLSA